MSAHTPESRKTPHIESRPCTWCGLLIESPETESPTCCSGCEAAAAMVSAAGLTHYFEHRARAAPRPSEQATQDWCGIETVELPDGLRRSKFQVQGLRCASCVWVTEKILRRETGVVEARVSYGWGQAEVLWDPEQTVLATILHRVCQLGYACMPLSLPSHRVSPDLLRRLGVALFGAVNVMMLSVGIYLGWSSGMSPAYQALIAWAILALSTPVVTWSAAPFFQAAWSGLRAGLLHMDLPLSLGIATLYGHGLWATIHGEDAYLDSLTMLVALLLLGRLLEQRGKSKVALAATTLAARVPGLARRVSESGVETVPSGSLSIGDILEVASGEEVAADGTVVTGTAEIQMALLTGESEAAQVAPGDQVVAGGVVMTGRVQVAVQAIGSETTLSRMASGLEKATQSPPRESAEERWVPWFVAGTIGTALLTALGWTLMHGFASALEPTIAVLVVACPCALALSRPLATAVGLGASARRGMLFRSGEALQALADIDRVAMDKTGTLTRGCLEVVFASDPVLRVAAGIERGSIHPIARAIVEEAQARGIPIPEGRRIQEVPGHGIRGWVDGVCWEIQRSARRGRVEVVGLGEIGLRDRIRSDARHTVEALRRLGLEPLLLTGDQHSVTQLIAKEAGITQAIPALSPQDKAAWIQRRQTASERILYLGDGLNDGLALATANVGIAMGSGAASSVLAADAVIAREGLGPVIAAIRAARATRDAIRVSVRRSLAFNILAVSAAAAGLVNPLVAAILMPLSSGLVLLEALRIEHVVDMHERSR